MSQKSSVPQVAKSVSQALIPDSAGWPAGRDQHCGVVSARRHSRGTLLCLVERVPGGRQATSGGRHGTCSDKWRGQGAAASGPGAQGGRGRAALELRLLKKSMIADGGDEE